MPSDENAYLRVKIETADVSEQVWSVDIEDRDRGTDIATLVMDNPGSTNSDALQEGEKVQIEVGWETEHALVFEGYIGRTDTTSRELASNRIRVVAKDPSRIMTSQPAVTREHVGTLEEILTAIMARNSIPMGRVSIDPMPNWTEQDSLRQVCANEWAFIQELAEVYRARAFIEVNTAEEDSEAVRERGGSARFYFVSESVLLEQEPMGKLLYCRGMGGLLEFEYTRVASGASPSAAATVTNPDTGAEEARTGPPPAEGPVPEASEDRSARVEAVHGSGRSASYGGSVQVAADAEVQPTALRARSTLSGIPSSPALAELRVQQDRTRILGFNGRGLAMGTVFLRAKGSVEIDGLATWAKGRWYVSRVNHVVQRTRVADATQLTYRSRFVATR
jgi:phage protein D